MNVCAQWLTTKYQQKLLSLTLLQAKEPWMEKNWQTTHGLESWRVLYISLTTCSFIAVMWADSVPPHFKLHLQGIILLLWFQLTLHGGHVSNNTKNVLSHLSNRYIWSQNNKPLNRTWLAKQEWISCDTLFPALADSNVSHAVKGYLLIC